MTEHYYTVGVHGPPTPETAPHGYLYVADGDWREGVKSAASTYRVVNKQTIWWPLPAPPTEEAPAPEPVGRWRVNESPGRTHARILLDNCDVMTCEDANAAADALNTLEADGVCYGPGRPMSELPNKHKKRVLIANSSGFVWTDMGTNRAWDEHAMRVCWWPLPVVAQ